MLLCAFGLSILLARPQATPPETPRALLSQFITALNDPDRGKLRSFLSDWSNLGAKLDQAVRLFGGVADQGAPFKIVADGPQTSGEVDSIVVSRSGSRLAFMMRFQETPRLRFESFFVRPAYVVEGPPPELRDWPDLTALASKIAGLSQSPAVGIAVLRDGNLQVGVSGVRKLGNKEPVSPNDVWSIGSIGKSICSTIIGRLIEQGKLRWDEPLSEALAGIPMDHRYEAVTLEQLMRHRGGIPQDSTFTGDRVDQIVGTAKSPIEIRERYAKDVLSRAPLSTPGTSFAYSNAGYSLLSVVAERAAGKPYEALIHELVFEPLGLKRSYTDVDPLPTPRPSGHLVEPSGLVPGNMSGPIEAMLAGAGGGLFMSLGDLATYGAVHLAGLRGQDGLLKAATVQRLHRGQPEGSGPGRFYGCGWLVAESVPGLQPFDGHNGSNGTMRSEIAIFPQANLVVVGIANCGGENEPAPGFEAVMAVALRYAPAQKFPIGDAQR